MPEWFSDALTHNYLRNPLWLWIVALSIAIAGTILLSATRTLVAKFLRRRALATATRADDLLVDLIDRLHGIFFLGLMIAAGTNLLRKLPENLEDWIDRIAVIGAIFQGGVWGTMLVQRFIEHRFHVGDKDDPAKATGVALLKFMGMVIVWTLVLLMVLDHVGVNITTLVAGLGVGGVAVALALQNILGDLFASVSILLDKPFVVGDFIIIDQYMGSVERIGVKTTHLRSLGGEQIVFANNDLLKSRIRNYKRMRERRIVFKIGVVYATPHQQLQEIPRMLREAVEAQPDTRFDRAHFATYGDFSLVFEVVYYVLSPDYTRYMDIQQEINFDIHRRFEGAGIDFAFPTQTLHINGAIRDSRESRNDDAQIPRET